jgi:hypothetical protein
LLLNSDILTILTILTILPILQIAARNPSRYEQNSQNDGPSTLRWTQGGQSSGQARILNGSRESGRAAVRQTRADAVHADAGTFA